jgi:site-specific DNA-methyltransferase (adenine-specific)
MKTLNKIFHQNFLVGAKQLPDECADLIIADPPYNLGKDFGEWNEKKRKNDWLPWSKEWILEAKRILKPTGSIFIYGIHKHLCWIQCYLFEIGLKYRRQIIWYYQNGFAGYSEKTLAAHYEPILWFSKSDNYTYHPIREPYKSEERLKYKIKKNGKTWHPHPEGRLAGDVWAFPTLAGKRFSNEKVNHPTQKPLSISLRIVNHFSHKNDLIIIPFAGSGTECLAAAMEDRNFIGFELNKEYIKIANKRIRDWHKQDRLTSDSREAQGSLHKDLNFFP